MEAGEEMLKVCIGLGGALTGEHGVGLEKKDCMPMMFTEQDMDAMKKVRDAFSPGGDFNPGKIFPGGPQYDRELQRKAVSSTGPGAYI